MILDSNCNSGSSTSDDDIHNLKVKRYKSENGRKQACRLRCVIWFFAIIFGACIVSLAMYFFVRYGYEQQVYDRIIAAEIQADSESKKLN